MIGTRLNHFQVTAKLGQGGMGEIYRAEDTRLSRQVAIKVLPEEFTADPERLARFEREAQVVAGLNHPNICTLYDVGHVETPAGRVHYLAMELVEGESLGDRIARGLGHDEAIAIATQIAEALEAAHAKGIVHRDLKPANVMLVGKGDRSIDLSPGTVKVLDFGLAKGWAGPREASPNSSHSPTLTRQMTQAGMILGTAGYMSPEQARGAEADQRADIWAWGVILHEMLTGRQLFDEPTVSDTLAAVLRADLDWKRLPDNTPRRVRRVLRRCLERNPKNRLHSISDARIELESDESEEPPTGTEPVLHAPSNKKMWVAAAVGLLGLAIGAAGWWTSPATPELPLRMLELAHGEGLSGAVISPDGQRVALVRKGRLYLRELDSMDENEIAGVDDIAASGALFWSPEGRRIGYATWDAIYTVPVSGGAPQLVCEIPDSTRSEGAVLGATWVRTDTIVFALDGRGLWQVPVLGGEPQPFLMPDREGKHEAALHVPSLLPDGETLLARVRWRDKANDTITFLRDGKRTDVTYAGWDIGRAVVSASGHLIFTRGDQDAGIWAAPFSMSELQATGDPVRLLTGSFSGLSLDAGGALVTSSFPEFLATAAIVDREGTVRREFEDLGSARDLAVSPDGKKLAVWGIRVHDGQRTIDVTSSFATRPTWSPDGRELIYRDEGGLFRVPADGTRDPVQIFAGEVDTAHWSPDGKVVAFTVYVGEIEDAPERDILLGRTSRTDIAVLELEASGEPRPFRDSAANELYPRFSPDGRFLVYASDASGRAEIYVTPFPAGDRRWQVSSDGGRFPRWSSAGDEIYFVSGGSLMATSFKAGIDVEIGAPSALLSSSDQALRFEAFGQSTYDVTPDGHFVASTLRTNEESSVLLIQNWQALFLRTR